MAAPLVVAVGRSCKGGERQHDSQCDFGSYDKRNLLKEVKVSFDTTRPMILMATVDLEFSGEVFQHSKDLLVSIEYHPNASTLLPLWSERQEIDCSRSPGADISSPHSPYYPYRRGFGLRPTCHRARPSTP